MKNTSLVLLLVFSLFIQVVAQTPVPQQAQADGDDDVVRITTNLVQIDAVVVDKSGKQVTDLRADEFEIFEDGRPQPITNFSYVEVGAQQMAARPNAPKPSPSVPAIPLRLSPEQLRRTIVLVADDLGLSFESTVRVRNSMKKFVDEKLRPGDLVAIARTGAGVGALQQLTSDKRQLYAAIDRIRWRTDSRVGTSNFGEGSKPILSTIKRAAAYSLNALSFIVKGLKGLPGRKSVILFSDDFSVFPSVSDIDLKLDGSGQTGIGEVMKTLDEMLEKGADLTPRQQFEAEPGKAVARLVDRANQASVVIYTVDTRGLPIITVGRSAPKNPEEAGKALGSASQKHFNTQVGLRFVAEQTGGFAFINNNDIDLGIERVLDDLKGYYLIGYRPSEETFGRSRFHKISVRVKRPGLQVRSRKGFYGVTEEERRTAPRTRSEELIAAMTSPFQAETIDLRLTSLFNNDLKAGSFMRSVLHIDARALKFEADSEGWQTARMEVAALTLNDEGKIVNQVTRDETIKVRGESYQRLLRNGLVYSFDVPVKTPGNYQLRIGVRDPSTKLLGSAGQLIEVPDLKKNRLALSGIYARGVDADAPPPQSMTMISASAGAGGLLAGRPEIGDAAGANGESGVQPGAATRRLKRGMALDYSFVVFNAQADRATRRPQLQTQLILLRNGEQVLARNLQLPDAAVASNYKRLEATGRLDIGAEMQPGEYILQIVVTDPFAEEKYRVATQWIDFEVVK